MNGTLKLFLLIALVATATLVASAQSAFNVSSFPLWFEANQGQMGSDTGFVAHGRNAQFLISADGAAFTLRKADGTFARVRMQLVGADASAPLRGDREMSSKVSYLIGNQPSQWQSGLTTFGRVKVAGVYPGVDVVYYGNQRELEYDFNLAAGVSPQTIAMRFDGAEQMSVNAAGELVVKIDGSTIYQHRPEVYQTQNGVRQTVTGSYKILDAHTVTFAVGPYDHDLPLVIDPILGYSTFFGGNSGEQAWAMTLDSAGYVYITGNTFSTMFSNAIPFGVYSNFSGGLITGDAFVAKFDSSGTNLIFLTYLGGSGDDSGKALALDSQGNIIVTGFTSSTNFPTAGFVAGFTNHITGQAIPLLGPVYPTDVFVAKLSNDGSTLLYGGYMGGNQTDGATALAIDPANDNAIIAGYTYSTNFPCTTNTAFQTHLNCTNSLYYNYNSFISVISFSQSNLLYSTFYGGTNQDVIRGIAFTNGDLFVTGITDSTNRYGLNGPTTNIVYSYVMGTNHFAVTNVIQSTILNGPLATNTTFYTAYYDAFVAAFNVPSSTNPSDFTQFTNLYSMYLGGNYNDYAYAIAVDGGNNAYVVGATTSTNFPYVVPNSLAVTNLSYLATNQAFFGLATNAFLTQITWNGSQAAIGYSVEFGGFGIDVANAVALDSQGNIYVVGSATSTNFPITVPKVGNNGLLIGTNSGGSDAVIAYFNTSSGLPSYGAYWGGSGNDFANAVAVDASNNVFVVGQTYSTNFPINNASDKHLSGTNDLFLSKLIAGWSTPGLQLSRYSTNEYVLYWPPLPGGSGTSLYLESATNGFFTNWFVLTNITTLTSPFTFTDFTYGTNVFTNAPTTTISNGYSVYGFVTTNPAQLFRLHQY